MENKIEKLEKELQSLPQGSLIYKKIKGKEQPYIQWSENGKTQSKYVKIAERETVLQQYTRKKEIQEELRLLRNTSAPEEPTPAMQFKTHVVTGKSLKQFVSPVIGMEKRDCYVALEKYITGNYPNRVCLLYGLRRTGKTTLLLQAIHNLPPKEFRRAAYIKARITDSMADLNHDIRLLEDAGYKYVFIDEVTLIEDFIDSAAVLSDIYAAMGIKIVLSGTDSLGFWLTLKQELYDRAITIHTTFIPFHEYSRLLGIDDIDTYIRYGGTLRMGETNFDDDALLEGSESFRDDESTRRYIDTAICKNIQRSLEFCRDGSYFRHLVSLYEAGELTNAINRIIESMNHRFLLSTILRKFKSHDLGSAADLLSKEKDPEKRTYLLDEVDRAEIATKLAQLLDIREKEDLTIGITQTHVAEIKQYLEALDLIQECPAETTVATESMEYVLFTQPGMRYSQAQALVHVLTKDLIFQAANEKEKDIVCAKILEDVRGRMMEDMILLETSRALPKNKKVFKLILESSEFDMVIYDRDTNTCEAYEIKHSTELVPNQYHILADEEQCAVVAKKYGNIVKKCVIYRGDNMVLDNGIEYRNAEEYLKNLPARPSHGYHL